MRPSSAEPPRADQRRLLHVFTVPQSLRFLRGQTAHMRDAGFEVHVACGGAPAQLAAEGRKLDVPVHFVPLQRSIAPAADLRALGALVRVVRRLDPDIVHGHTPKGGLLGMLAASLSGVGARVYHMRGLPLETASGPTRHLLGATERISCGLARRVVCVSRSLRREAVERGLVDAAKATVLAHGSGNGVDASGRFRPDPALGRAHRVRLDLPPDVPVLLFVGRFAVDKGIGDLAMMWRALRRRNERVHLLMVGGNDARQPIPKSLEEELRSDSRVRLLPWVEDVAGAYAAADLLVFPSHREGFPGAPLEAGAMGLPTVASDATGCIDAVVDGETGSLFERGNWRQMAALVSRYLDDPGLRAAHGAAARARILRDFRPQGIWSALQREYESLLAAP